MSALTDSFPLSHITNHLLSTYPVFKAIFSPDGRNVACIKVKSQSHLPIHSLNEKPQFHPLHSCITASNEETAQATVWRCNKLSEAHTAELLTATFNMTHLIIRIRHPGPPNGHLSAKCQLCDLHSVME